VFNWMLVNISRPFRNVEWQETSFTFKGLFPK